MTTPFTIYASIVLATFTRNAFHDIFPQQLLRSAIEKSGYRSAVTLMEALR